ncbi:DUF4870 domain-containing protein [Pseudactinotalea sp. Z1748]|uniref:DUF4870 domain-containing protein n=1 Tax=Pseudactinotalea sp. Z1748 TaxID=3413027 RepID=UPI003C7CD419
MSQDYPNAPGPGEHSPGAQNPGGQYPQNPPPGVPPVSGHQGAAGQGGSPPVGGYQGAGGQGGGYHGGHQHDGRPSDPGAGADERTLAIVAHLSPIIAFVVSAGFLSVLGPLLIWMFFRDRGPLVRNASATAFNFHITVWVAIIVGWICFFTIVLIPLGIVIWLVAVGAQVVFSILGAVRANRREIYTYPFQVPILT